jgi:transcriptional/translational regulatory protein YebC/TACO1
MYYLALKNNHLLTNFIIRARIGGSGTAMHSFERKGIVEIELDEEDSTNHDDHIEMALEAEAEDVSMKTREDGVNVLQV